MGHVCVQEIASWQLINKTSVNCRVIALMAMDMLADKRIVIVPS